MEQAGEPAVSRGTEDPLAGAREVFGDRFPVAERYAAFLADAGVERGLLGPREVTRLWDRHLLNCAVLTDLVPDGATVADIGSGAGLPGLAMAVRRPDLRVTLVESLQRRAEFLREAATLLELPLVDVAHDRAEALHGRRHFQIVTSRAVAPLARLAAWSLPLVDAPGSVLAIKGHRVGDEIVAARPTVQRLGGSEPEILHIGGDVLPVPSTVLRIRVEHSRRLDSAGRRRRPPSSRGAG